MYDLIKKEHGHSLNELKNSSTAKHYDFVLPQPALGELMAKIFTDLKGKDLNEAFAELRKIVETLSISPEGVTSKALEIAGELGDEDEFLDKQPTDRLIVGMALGDAEVERLLTLDSKLIGNRAIQDFAKRMIQRKEREYGLYITDSLR